ncbi:MAG: hypothetical protein WBQ50_09260 [Nocardioides sp.]
MTWDAFHRRADVLRAVVAHADEQQDGLVPLHLPGVAETFADEADLVGALRLRWNTRESGHLERELMERGDDLAMARVAARRATERDLPGVRMILDRYVALAA